MLRDDGDRRLSAFFYGEKAHEREAVMVFDIGCSGGLGREWDIFGACLRAVAFDPLESEIARLTRADPRPNIRYIAASVGLSSVQERERKLLESTLSEKDRFQGGLLPDRTSAALAAKLIEYDYEKEIYNFGANKTYSSFRIALDEFADQHALENVDVLKIDTDGYDIEVLIGAQKLLESTVLAAKIECYFHGQNSPYANTFSNIDRLMTSKGFYLFDVKPQTYTRSALPGPFKYDIMAQTIGGVPVCADVLYLRDLAHPDYEKVFGFRATTERVIRTACIMDSFGLKDCAAELIINKSGRLPYPMDQMLDLLVPDSLGPRLSYQEYMERFMADPTALFPFRLGQQRASLPSITASQELPLERALTYPQWNATLTSFPDGRLLVRTSRHKWGYAMILPLPDQQRPGALVVEASGIEGELAVSIANADCTELVAEAIFTEEFKGNTIILPVSAAASILLIRNGSRETSSSIAISRVVFFPQQGRVLKGSRCRYP